MKGILPKPSILELNEYDVKQRIIEALTNTCSHAILFSIVIKAKNAVQISQELQLSLSAVYKTLANLEKLTLVTIEDFEFSNEGKKIKRYRSRIKKANIEIGVNDYEVSLYSVKTNKFLLNDKEILQHVSCHG